MSIVTKIIPATATRGTRIRAECYFLGDVKRATLPYSYSLSDLENAKIAAAMLIFKHGLEWGDDFIGGYLRDGQHVFLPMLKHTTFKMDQV